jgi:hypothetical protein
MAREGWFQENRWAMACRGWQPEGSPLSEMKWMKWFCIGLLATGCAFATGCGGGDDDNSDTADGGGTTVTNVLNPSGGGGTVVTNVVLVPGPGGSTTTNLVIVTNAPADDTPAPLPPLFVRLAAPELVAPPNNGPSYPTSGTLSINFQWTAVPKAATYVLEVGGSQYVTDGTGMTRQFSPGIYTWRVWARDASRRDGLPSATFTFGVVQRN